MTSRLLGVMALVGAVSLVTPAKADEVVDRHPAILAEHFETHSPNYWLVGVSGEAGLLKLTDTRIDDLRVGVTIDYRRGAWGPYLRVSAGPGGRDAPQNLSAAAESGLRAHFPLGGHEFSYGVGTQLEVRLRSGLWLATATPLELGTDLWSRGSGRIQLHVGLRRVFAGQLINSYLLDPNGFDNENRADELAEIKEDRPWQAFVRLTFARQL